MKQSHRNLPVGGARLLLAALLLLACVLFIFGNSVLSSLESSRFSQAVASHLQRIFGGILGDRHPLVLFVHNNVRKIAHAMEFCALGIACALLLTVLRRASVSFILHGVLFALAVAVADESIQIFTGRGAMVQDVLLDFAGAMAGFFGTLLCFSVIRALFQAPEGK